MEIQVQFGSEKKSGSVKQVNSQHYPFFLAQQPK
jgi:hypothetical protein